jgi:hypothetical protein
MPYRLRDLEAKFQPAPTPDAAARWSALIRLIARAQERTFKEESNYETPDIRNAPPDRGAPVSE